MFQVKFKMITICIVFRRKRGPRGKGTFRKSSTEAVSNLRNTRLVNTHTHTHTHTCIYIYIYMYIYIYIFTILFAYLHTPVF